VSGDDTEMCGYAHGGPGLRAPRWQATG